MSLQITRAGFLDTVQDLGRYGFQHQGINPGGAMDRFSAALSNALLGKALTSPVIEMHFPAAQMLFEEPCVMCITGADFTPVINDVSTPLNQPVFVGAMSHLTCKQWKTGARAYLSLLNKWQLNKWLSSFSTNLKAGAGGFQGRRLEKGDCLFFEKLALPIVQKGITALPWKYNLLDDPDKQIAVLPGPEWDWLTPESQTLFLQEAFFITHSSDRMGYRLKGEPLEQERKEQLVSSAVNFGTVQLLPNGQLIVLMADHQTTGGYPRIANVISTHVPKLAQMKPGEKINFGKTDLVSAQQKIVEQHHFLVRLQQTCQQKMQTWLHAHRS